LLGIELVEFVLHNLADLRFLDEAWCSSLISYNSFYLPLKFHE
jgi:hypothetical protein